MPHTDIELIKKAEREVLEELEGARMNARRIIEEAHREGSDRLRKKRQEAQEFLMATESLAIRAATSEAADVRERANVEAEATMTRCAPKIFAAVQCILRVVTGGIDVTSCTDE